MKVKTEYGSIKGRVKRRRIKTLTTWILRVILMCAWSYFLYDLGADIIPAIIGGIEVIAFWSWYFWIDNIENPITRYDEND